MSETDITSGASDEVEASEDEKLNEVQAAEIAERQQFGQTGDMLDTTIGNQGGAGASATGPDITKQSEPRPGNHSDLPAGQR